MLNFVKWPLVLVAVILNGYIPLVSGDTSVNGRLVASFEEMLPTLVASGDYRTASNVAFQLASAHRRLGENPGLLRRVSQSLEHYRMALAKEAGGFQKASSISDDSDVMATLNDDSDGMAVVRAKFGCV